MRIAAAALVLLWSGLAHASNVLEVPDLGTQAMGRGGAWLAKASDPLASVWNPAGLAGQRTSLTLQGSAAFMHTCFSRVRASNDTSTDAAAGFSRVCNDAAPLFVPQIAATWQVSPRLGLGLYVGAPAASGTKDWPEFVNGRPAPQRYLLTDQSTVLLFPTLAAGVQVLPELRIGASFGWGVAHLKSSSATVALANGGQTPDNDILAKIQVRDAFVPRLGLGAIWKLSSRFDLAGWYQWTDAIRASGDLGTATSYWSSENARGDDRRVGYADTYFSDCGTGRAQDAGKCGSGDNARLKLPLPMEAKVGLRTHAPDERWDAEVDLTWANDSAIDSIEVRFPGDASGAGRLPVAGINAEIPPNADQPRRYRDVLGLRAGGDYAVLPGLLTLRAGTFYETAATRGEHRALDVAATARFGLALGASVHVKLGGHALELMAAYGHTFFADDTQTDPNARGTPAIAGTSCSSSAVPVSPGTCSDGGPRYRTRWPVDLGTVTNAFNVVHAGATYRF